MLLNLISSYRRILPAQQFINSLSVYNIFAGFSLSGFSGKIPFRFGAPNTICRLWRALSLLLLLSASVHNRDKRIDHQVRQPKQTDKHQSRQQQLMLTLTRAHTRTHTHTHIRTHIERYAHSHCRKPAFSSFVVRALHSAAGSRTGDCWRC